MCLKTRGSEKKPHSKSSCSRFSFCNQLIICSMFLISLSAMIKTRKNSQNITVSSGCWSHLKVHSQVWDNFLQLKALWKWGKMLFISPEKLFLFSRYLSFCLDFSVMYLNGLIKKIGSISNFMTSQPCWQTIVIHIFPNISRSKGNHTMEFGQNVTRKTCFLKNHTENVVEKLVLGSFLKN